MMMGKGGALGREEEDTRRTGRTPLYSLVAPLYSAGHSNTPDLWYVRGLRWSSIS